MNDVEVWLRAIGWKDFSIEVASADASFRQYFRVTMENRDYIVMDSSLEKESLPPFVDITQRLLKVGVRAPVILEQDISRGYLIIEDFGTTLYLDVLDDLNYKHLYRKAMEEIRKMQEADVHGLPLYDKKFLHVEMDLMAEWFLQQYLGKTLTEVEKQMLASALEGISDVVLSQPQELFVHRDYHSRNIMLTPEGAIGVIDYQDAMSGAVTYDLVSLLKDCYIEYAPDEVEKLALAFRDLKAIDVDDVTFIRWFDFMGLQRHIKVLGVFSRLYLRDGKEGYLKDIPLTLKYVVETAGKYEQTQGLSKMLGSITLP